MKSTSKREKNLNKSSKGCAPCLNEILKIDRQINERSLNEIKIKEIKEIVNSIFNNSNDINQKN